MFKLSLFLRTIKPKVRFGSVHTQIFEPRFRFIPVPVHTGSGSHRFTVEADPLTGHKLGQISSPRRLSTIFLISEARLFFLKRV